MVKFPQTSIIIPLWSSYYTPKLPQNKIIQTSLKHYNQLRSVITEAIRWLQITTDTGMKLKVETTVKEKYQQLL